MTSYHFHMRGGEDRSLTPDGVQLADLDAAKIEALRNAREIMAHDVLMGRLDVNLYIDVRGDEGELVYSLSFRDAVTVVGLIAS